MAESLSGDGRFVNTCECDAGEEKDGTISTVWCCLSMTENVFRQVVDRPEEADDDAALC